VAQSTTPLNGTVPRMNNMEPIKFGSTLRCDCKKLILFYIMKSSMSPHLFYKDTFKYFRNNLSTCIVLKCCTKFPLQYKICTSLTHAHVRVVTWTIEDGWTDGRTMAVGSSVT
jgi:hypothetical protein